MTRENLEQELAKLGKEAEKPEEKSVESILPVNHMERGNENYQRGDYSKAEESYKRATEVDPDSFIAHVALGYFYYKIGEYDKAEESCKKAIEINPKSPLGYFYLGHVYLDTKDLKKAKQAYGRAVELDPESELFLDSLKQVGWRRWIT